MIHMFLVEPRPTHVLKGCESHNEPNHVLHNSRQHGQSTAEVLAVIVRNGNPGTARSVGSCRSWNPTLVAHSGLQARSVQSEVALDTSSIQCSDMTHACVKSNECKNALKSLKVSKATSLWTLLG